MTSEDRPQRLLIGVCGAGDDAGRWARALRGVDGVEIERIGSFSDDALLAALAREDLAAVALPGTTPDLPAAIRRALLSGRHVLVTATPALAADQLQALADLARRRTRALIFDAPALGDPRVDFARRMTAGPHALWRPRYARSLRAAADEAGSLDELAVADLSLVLRLMGDRVSHVSALAPWVDDERGATDAAMMTLRFAGGALARVDVTLVEPAPRHELVLACEGRSLVFDAYDLRAPLQILASARHNGPRHAGWSETVSEHPPGEMTDRLSRVAEGFCAAVRSRDAGASNAAELASAAAVWQGARESMRRAGEYVGLEDQASAPAKRAAFRVIAGGGRGDGVSSAALEVVPVRPAVEAPLSSA